MTDGTIMNEKRKIAKQFLLSSPPGQFQQTLKDLNDILTIHNDSANHVTNTILSREFVNQVQNEFNTKTGREVLILLQNNNQKDADNTNAAKNNDISENEENAEEDKLGKSLKASLQKYMDKYYKNKNVESNYHLTSNQSRNNGCYSYEIMVYAERIMLKQYHTGAWFAKYTIVQNDNGNNNNSERNEYTLSGVVLLHGHSFEDGNVHVQSNVTLPSKIIQVQQSPESMSLLSEKIMDTIQNWDEEYVLRPLKGMYDGLSTDLLKRMRRVMPVTRTKFDWNNLSGHRFVKAIEKDVTR